MSEYKKLIKQFDKIRSYVRDFCIYGFPHTHPDLAVEKAVDNKRLE